jgi:hypothetical protein
LQPCLGTTGHDRDCGGFLTIQRPAGHFNRLIHPPAQNQERKNGDAGKIESEFTGGRGVASSLVWLRITTTTRQRVRLPFPPSEGGIQGVGSLDIVCLPSTPPAPPSKGGGDPFAFVLRESSAPLNDDFDQRLLLTIALSAETSRKEGEPGGRPRGSGRAVDCGFAEAGWSGVSPSTPKPAPGRAHDSLGGGAGLMGRLAFFSPEPRSRFPTLELDAA